MMMMMMMMMVPRFLNLALLLSLCARSAAGQPVGEDVRQVESVSGADCELPCTAENKPGVQYRAVRWYKVGEAPSPRLSGLLTRDFVNGTTRYYGGVDREVQLRAEARSIFLPNVTCGDAGTYMCHLAAPVGEQNREGLVLLTLTDCSVRAAEQLMTDTYLVVFASVVLMLALLIFLISYGSLKNILKDRNKAAKKEVFLDAPLKPLQKKDLMLIYTLGPKTSTMKHVCV